MLQKSILVKIMSLAFGFCLAFGSFERVQAKSLGGCTKVFAVISLCASGVLTACNSDLGGTRVEGSVGSAAIRSVHRESAPNSPWGAKVTPLAEKDATTQTKIIQIEVAKYPEGFISKHLKNIFICEDCIVMGDRAGGFFSPLYPKDIMIANSARDSFDHLVFHHEFAHLLWHKFGSKEFEKAWTEANGSEYLGREWRDLQLSESHRLAAGFSSTYAYKNFHEDFAETAQWLWSDPRGLFKTAKNNERLMKKVALILWFYESLDSRLTPAYFLKLKRTRAADEYSS